MRPRLLRRQISGIHLLLDVGMIFRELAEAVIAQQVRTTVAYLPDQESRLEQRQRGDSGPHAALVVLGECALEDRAVGGADRPAHPLGYLLVAQPAQRVELSRHEAHGHFTGHFARSVPTHAVGNDEDAAVGYHEVAILIPRPDDADIGAPSGCDMHVMSR